MILVVGLSHRTAPVEVRERFATGPDVLPAVLARLASRRELDEVLFLSTCNRVEVFAKSPKGGDESAVRAIREVFAEHGKASSAEEIAPSLYDKSGDEAVRHIFRVAASLDSMVLGEPQILGQVKDAYDAAIAAGSLASFLGRCVYRAFTVAKRVRTETALGAGTVSISSVAVDLARKIFGDLSKSTVLLVGAGEMAEQAAKSLGKGAHSVRVCNRSFDRGAALARDFGGSVAPWEALEDELLAADIVVASTGSPSYVVTRDMVKRAMKARRNKTLFIVDIAVPRNVEPSVHKIDNVYVFNVDDLEHEVAQGLAARKNEVEAAEAIVAHEARRVPRLGARPRRPTDRRRAPYEDARGVDLGARTDARRATETSPRGGSRRPPADDREHDEQAPPRTDFATEGRRRDGRRGRFRRRAPASLRSPRNVPVAPRDNHAPARAARRRRPPASLTHPLHRSAPQTMARLVYATRRSPLALAQCRAFVARIAAKSTPGSSSSSFRS